MPDPYARIAGLALVAGLLSALLTFALIKLDKWLRLTAIPRSDRWHRNPTPNSGGVAIFLSCAAIYALAGAGQYRAVALGAASICLLGFLDDRVQLRPLVKLLCQCLISLAVVLSGVVFPATPWHFANLAFSLLWIVGITNAFNLIDNMDGLCAGVAIIIAGFRFWLLAASGFWQDALLCAILGAALGGFLVFNYRPAKIFMGDCGSMFAGFTLAALAIASPLAHTKVFLAGFFYPALSFAYPIFDTLLVSILRKAAGRKISVGGRDHSSHRLASLGLPEHRVVWIFWSLTAVGCAVGLMIHWMPLQVVAPIGFLVASLTMFGIFLATLPPYQIPRDGPILSSSLIRRHIPSLRAGLIVLVDSLIAGIALFSAFLIRYESEIPALQIHNFLISLPLVMICHGVLSCLDRTFTVAWRWFSLGDVLTLTRTVMLSAASSFFLLWLGEVREYPRGVMILYCMLCLGLIVSLRLSLRMMQDVFQTPGLDRMRVAILGANSDGELAASLLQKHSELNAVPVVFLDYEDAKHGLRIRGIPIRSCNSETLQKLAAEYHLEAVLMPHALSANGEYNKLGLDCVEAGLQLRLLEISIREVNSTTEPAGTVHP